MTGPGLDSLFLIPIHLFDNVFNKLLNLFHIYTHIQYEPPAFPLSQAIM